MNKGPLVGQGRTADIYAWGNTQVLKLFKDWCSEGMVQHEYEIAHIVQAAGLPVPKIDDAIIQTDGRRGVIYERVSGPSLLTRLRERPWKVVQYGRLLAELQVAIHACAAPDLPLWRDAMARDIRAAPGVPEDSRQAALAALTRLPIGENLCHGDFHPDNVIMTAHGPVVIDWVTAVRGNPAADVARSTLIMRLGEPPPGTPGLWLINLLRRQFIDAYYNSYLDLSGVSRAAIEAWELPIAAARMREGIANEIKGLCAIISQAAHSAA